MKKDLPCKNCKVNLYAYGKATSGGIRCSGCGRLNVPDKGESEAYREFMFWRRRIDR